MQPKALISADHEAKKSPIKDVSMKYNSFIVCFHKYDRFCHLATFITRLAQKGGQVTKPTCYKTIIFHSSSLKHLDGDFLASADIKAFGRT